MSNTHGLGHGVSGAALRALIAAHDVCPGCVGTRRQWCLQTRSNVPCLVCTGGIVDSRAHLASTASVSVDASAPLAAD